MEMEKYTERSKGFVQSAQNLALRSGHQRLTPEHLLKVLLEDKEGLCANLIKAAGGDPKIVLAQIAAEPGPIPPMARRDLVIHRRFTCRARRPRNASRCRCCSPSRSRP